MAIDLGVINYTNVNQGTRQVDRSAEVRGIQQGLNLAGSAAKGLILAGVEEDLNDAMKAGIEGLAQESNPAQSQNLDQLGPDDFSVYDLSEEERAEVVGIANTIRNAKNAIAQAPDTGRRNRALFQMKRAQQAAKAKFGFMSEEIDRAATVLQTTSPELFAAAMEDAAMADSIAARNSQEDVITQMQKAAKEMGIPPDIPMESPEFAYLYQKETRNNYKQASKQREYEMLAATNNLSGKKQLETVMSDLTEGYGALERDFYKPLRAELAEISDLRRGVALGEASESELNQAVQEFQAMAGDFEQRAFKAERKIMQNFYEKFQGYDPESAEYKQALRASESAIDDLKTGLALMQRGDIDMVEYIKAQSYARGASLRENMPNLNKIIDLASNANFDVWAVMDKLSHTYGNYALEQMVSEGLQSELGNVFGQYVIDKTATEGMAPEQRDAALQAIDVQDPKSGGLTESPFGSVEHAQEIWAQIEERSLGMLYTTPAALESPGVADSVLSTITDQTGRLQRSINAAKAGHPTLDVTDQVEGITRLYGGDAFFELVQRAGLEERDNLGYVVETHLLPGGLRGAASMGILPQEKMFTDIQNRAEQDTYGASFIDVVEADLSRKDEEGVITFKVNEEALNKAVNKRLDEIPPTVTMTGVSFMPESARESVRAQALKNARRQAAELSEATTQYLRIRAYANLNGAPDTLDFNTGLVKQFDKVNLVQIFGL